MTAIYLIVHNYLVDDYNGREHTEEDADLEQWFPSEDAAREFMRRKGLHTYDETASEMSAKRDEVYSAAIRKYERDTRKVATAKKAGISPALLITPVKPVKPSRPEPRDWYEVVSINEYTPEERG